MTTRERDATLYADYLRLCPQHDGSGQATRKALAIRYGLSEHTVRKIVGAQAKGHVASVEAENERLREEVARLTRQPFDNDDAPPIPDDSDKVREMMLRLYQLPRYIRVLVVSDEHIDDHDSRALVMNAVVSEWADPDVTVFNGDTLDFGSLGRFDLDRRDGKQDAFRSVRRPLRQYQRSMRGRNKVWVGGNHNERQEAFSNMAWQLGGYHRGSIC